MSENSEKIFSGITNIDDDIIEEAQEKLSVKRNNSKKFIPVVVSAAAICLCGAAFGIVTAMNSNAPASADGEMSGKRSSKAVADKLIARAVYPGMPQYPEDLDSGDEEELWKYHEKYDEWSKAKAALRKQPEGYADGIDTFLTESMRAMLTTGGTDNRVYSPMSAFMALSMSAEITGGNTRQQILDLLGQKSIEDLRSHANSIWKANYSDDGMAKCVLASSLWLRDDMKYNTTTVNSLAENYYSSVFSGKPGTADYDAALQGWLNEQTDGQLESCVEGIKLDPEMIITLASTVDYAGKWVDKFDPAQTKEAVFHAPTGDISCDFLNKETDMQYWWSDKFAAVSLQLEQNGSMRLILPDEGITPEELLRDDVTMKFLTSEKIYKDFDNKYAMVELSIPKFDVSCETDIADMLKGLGVTDAFDGSVSDFSPLTDEDHLDIFISNAKHAARVQIDEEGCRASALTVMQYSGAAVPDGKAQFILDRPFIFEIMSNTGFPLFAGIVNVPMK